MIIIRLEHCVLFLTMIFARHNFILLCMPFWFSIKAWLLGARILLDAFFFAPLVCKIYSTLACGAWNMTKFQKDKHGTCCIYRLRIHVRGKCFIFLIFDKPRNKLTDKYNYSSDSLMDGSMSELVSIEKDLSSHLSVNEIGSQGRGHIFPNPSFLHLHVTIATLTSKSEISKKRLLWRKGRAVCVRYVAHVVQKK
jgi:hypothetical protein